jgi:hypothetical protein
MYKTDILMNTLVWNLEFGIWNLEFKKIISISIPCFHIPAAIFSSTIRRHSP